MEAYRILFNPLSGSGKGKENAEKLNGILSGAKLTYVDMTKISDYEALFDSLEPGEKLVVCGGDGSLQGGSRPSNRSAEGLSAGGRL